MSDQVALRYRAIADRVTRAAERSGRDAGSVVLVAVAKGFGAEGVTAVVGAGCRDVGESYVQEARAKRARVEPLRPRWHMIGRLQRNKARLAAETFDVVHSLDSLPLARALDRAAGGLARPIECLVEVNLGNETAKGGIPPDQIEVFLGSLGECLHLRVNGLMTIPPLVGDPERARPFFRRLRELRDRHADLPLANGELKDLSMGMSADFEVAIEEGATIVRVGQAIFGPRA